MTLPLAHHVADDGIARLFVFHDRIRAALADLGAVAHASERDEIWRVRAGVVWSFLRGPLVRHDEDEEYIVAPALRGRCGADGDAMLWKMADAHAGLEEQLEAIDHCLRRVAGGEDVDARDLAARATRFIAYVEMSLAAEERLFRRAADALSPDEKRALAAELDDAARIRRAAER